MRHSPTTKEQQRQKKHNTTKYHARTDYGETRVVEESGGQLHAEVLLMRKEEAEESKCMSVHKQISREVRDRHKGP